MVNPKFQMSSELWAKTAGWAFAGVSWAFLWVILGECLSTWLYSSTDWQVMVARPPVGSLEASIHDLLGTPVNSFVAAGVVVLVSCAIIWYGVSTRPAWRIGRYLAICGTANIVLALSATVLTPTAVESVWPYLIPGGATPYLAYRANYGRLLVLMFSVLIWIAGLLSFAVIWRRAATKQAGVVTTPAAG